MAFQVLSDEPPWPSPEEQDCMKWGLAFLMQFINDEVPQEIGFVFEG